MTEQIENNPYLDCELKIPFSTWSFYCKESIKSLKCRIDYLDDNSEQKGWFFENRQDYLKAILVIFLAQLEYELNHENRQAKIDHCRQEISQISNALVFLEGFHPANFAANAN